MAISKHDKQALADLFIHMGVPLVIAMQTVESWSGGAVEDLSGRAETLSKLLTTSVEFATKVTKKLEIRDAYTHENVRGKIIRIVTPIIAESYVRDGNMPSEEDLENLTGLFDVLISFSSSVSPTDEKGSKATKMAQMIEACDPILTAVRANNFGMSEKDAFEESVAGLKGRAEQLSPTLGLDHAIESGLFKAIVPIFVSCYNTTAENGDNFDAVWKECDERLALIHGLTAYVGQKAGIETTDVKPVEAKTESKPTAEPKKEDTPTEDKKDDNDDKGGDDANPMSFFAAGG